MAYVVWLLLPSSPSQSTRLASAAAGQLWMIAPEDFPHTGRSCGHGSSRPRLRTPRFGIRPRDGNAPGQLGSVALGPWNGHLGSEGAGCRSVPRERRPPRCLPEPLPGCESLVLWRSMCLVSASQLDVAWVSRPMYRLRDFARARIHSPCHRSCNWHMLAVHCCT